MASGGHLLAQQRPVVEARIKSLLNADLKEICKAYGAAVSGTKVVLQRRCIQGECKLVCHWERSRTAGKRDGQGQKVTIDWSSFTFHSPSTLARPTREKIE
jgi:hypothetical protein